MIKRKLIKAITFIIIGMLLFINPVSEAFDVQEQLGGELSSYAQIQTESEGFKNKVSTVLTIISSVGTVLSIIVLILIGIKYMTGSIEEKADYKKTLKPYLIGALMVFAIPNLLTALYTVVSGLF